MNKFKRNAGFSLPELLIVLAIVAIITTLGIQRLEFHLDRASKHVDLANARTVQSVLYYNYLDGSIEFVNNDPVFKDGAPENDSSCLAVYVSKEGVRCFGSNSVIVDGKTYFDDKSLFDRFKTKIEASGLEDLKVHCKKTANGGWDYMLIVLYPDGTVRTAGNPGEIEFLPNGSNFESAIKSAIGSTVTNLEKFRR